MNQASVGFHCPDCFKGGRQTVRTMSNLHGPPRATVGLIVANVAVFLYSLGQGSRSGRAGGEFLTDWGLFGPAVSFKEVPRGIPNGEWWRIITSGFSHSGLIHLGLNMWILWLIGQAVERSLGPSRFVAAWFCAIAGGALVGLLEAPLVFAVGASGGVYGLFGVVFMAQRRSGIDPWRSGIGGTILLNLVISIALPGIALGGHVGGLLAGFACGWIYYEGGAQLKGRHAPTVAVAVLAVALGAAAVVAAGTWTNPLVGDGFGLLN